MTISHDSTYVRRRRSQLATQPGLPLAPADTFQTRLDIRIRELKVLRILKLAPKPCGFDKSIDAASEGR